MIWFLCLNCVDLFRTKKKTWIASWNLLKNQLLFIQITDMWLNMGGGGKGGKNNPKKSSRTRVGK